MGHVGDNLARRPAPLNVMSHDDWATIELDPQLGEYVYMNAKTAAQRQAERKDRELAAGRVQWKRWVHPDDVPALTEYAEKLARKRAKCRLTT
jgi:hypothetical protein